MDNKLVDHLKEKIADIFKAPNAGELRIRANRKTPRRKKKKVNEE